MTTLILAGIISKLAFGGFIILVGGGFLVGVFVTLFFTRMFRRR
jgi:hypothetical protein